MRILDGDRRSEFKFVFCPVTGRHGYLTLSQDLRLGHRIVVDKFDAQFAAVAAGPHREDVLLAFLQTDAEESFVLDSGELVAVAGPVKAQIMRVALERAVVLDIHLSVSSPARQGVRKVERAVLDHVAVKAPVGSIVDVFEENAVHRRLYGNPGFLEIDIQTYGLGHEGKRSH